VAAVHPIDRLINRWASHIGRDGIDLRLRVYRALGAGGQWSNWRMRATLRMLLALHPEEVRELEQILDELLEPWAEEMGPAFWEGLERWSVDEALRVGRSDAGIEEPPIEEEEGEPSVVEIARAAPIVLPEPTPFERLPPPPAQPIHPPQRRTVTPPAAPPDPPPPAADVLEPPPLLPEPEPSIVRPTFFRRVAKRITVGFGAPQGLEYTDDEVLVDYRYPEPPRPFSEAELDRLARHARLAVPARLPGLDLRATVDATSRQGGLLSQVWRRDVADPCLFLARPRTLHPVTEAIVRALAEGLLARDVSVRVETGRPSGVQEGWRALVFIDASRYDTAWLQAWLGLGRTALVEVRDPALWCAAVGRLPRGCFAADAPGLSAALVAIEVGATPAHQAPPPARGREEELLGEALPLAACAFAFPIPSDLGAIDALRRTWLPWLPFLRIQRIMALRGVVADPSGWSCPLSLQAQLAERLGPDLRQSVMAWHLDRLNRLRARPGSRAAHLRDQMAAVIRLPLLLGRSGREPAPWSHELAETIDLLERHRADPRLGRGLESRIVSLVDPRIEEGDLGLQLVELGLVMEEAVVEPPLAVETEVEEDTGDDPTFLPPHAAPAQVSLAVLAEWKEDTNDDPCVLPPREAERGDEEPIVEPAAPREAMLEPTALPPVVDPLPVLSPPPSPSPPPSLSPVTVPSPAPAPSPVTAPSPLATPKPISAPRSERSVGGGGGTTAVGIDLGGAFSAIAYVNKWGVPEILHNAEGDRITPSVVLFDGDEIIVGNYAKQAAVAFPHQVVEFVKRHMGDDDYVFRYRGQDYSPEQLSSYILAKLKHDAELRLGEKIEDAVITIPAYFADKHRRATMRAGELAGLRVLKLINESTATAFAYGQSAGRSMRFMVFDLGGLYFN
jgi:hypothetical protein